MKAWFAELPISGQVTLGLLALVLLVGVAIFLFLRLRQYLEWQNVKTLEVKERVGLKIEFIKTAAQVLGGLFFLVTIYVAWANLEVSQEKYKTDLFVQAIKQLGDEKLEVRLGGIYALERIARDSDKDHGPIMEVLTAYVRENAPWPPKKPAEAEEQPDASGKTVLGVKKSEAKPAPEVKPRADIQAILTVLGRRTRTYWKGETQRLDLRQTDLRGADLRYAHLEGASFVGAHLEMAEFHYAHLEMAVLEKAHLENAILVGAYLDWANLYEAHLERAILSIAKLEGAILLDTHLESAELREAHLERADLQKAHLEGAVLPGAHLEGAKLWEAHLEGAYLENAHLTKARLEGADLSLAKGLTKGQIASAIIDDKTRLPDYLKQADLEKAKPQ